MQTQEAEKSRDTFENDYLKLQELLDQSEYDRLYMAKLRQVFEEAGQSRLLEEFEAASTAYETDDLDPEAEEEPEDEEADDADDPVDDDDAEGPEDEGDEGDEEGDDEADEVGEDEVGDDEVEEDDAGEDDLPGDEATKAKAKAKANESKKATSEDTDGKVRGSKGRPGRWESESVEVYSYHMLSSVIIYHGLSHFLALLHTSIPTYTLLTLHRTRTFLSKSCHPFNF